MGMLTGRVVNAVCGLSDCRAAAVMLSGAVLMGAGATLSACGDVDTDSGSDSVVVTVPEVTEPASEPSFTLPRTPIVKTTQIAPPIVGQ